PTQKTVSEALRGRRACVSPNVGGYTVVFDSVCDKQETQSIHSFTARLSDELHCVAWAVVVHDNDILLYFLFRNGILADWYNSSPTYFDYRSKPAGPAGGDAAQLCPVFDMDNQRAVESVLRGEYAFEADRHADLVRLLGLPGFAVGTTLTSIQR